MTGIAIKDIPGALITNKECFIHEFEVDGQKYKNINPKNIGFNEALTQQGEVILTLGREKLAILLAENCGVGVGYCKEYWLPKADAILADLPALIEVVK